MFFLSIASSCAVQGLEGFIKINFIKNVCPKHLNCTHILTRVLKYLTTNTMNEPPTCVMWASNTRAQQHCQKRIPHKCLWAIEFLVYRGTKKHDATLETRRTKRSRNLFNGDAKSVSGLSWRDAFVHRFTPSETILHGCASARLFAFFFFLYVIRMGGVHRPQGGPCAYQLLVFWSGFQYSGLFTRSLMGLYSLVYVRVPIMINIGILDSLPWCICLKAF